MADGARKKRILSIVTAVLLVIVAACVAACNGNADTKPTLTFMNGDSVFRTYELSAGEAITDLGMPAKEGYTFTGWKDGEGTDYVPGTMPEESLTVYAQFRANTYTIAFTAGGGTSGSLSDIEASYDADVTLPSSGVSLQGRGIKGYTDVEGSTDVKWQPGATVRNLTAEDGATVTLYVLFEDEAAAIDFIIEDGVVTGYTGYGEHITLPAEATAIADGAFARRGFSQNGNRARHVYGDRVRRVRGLQRHREADGSVYRRQCGGEYVPRVHLRRVALSRQQLYLSDERDHRRGNG